MREHRVRSSLLIGIVLVVTTSILFWLIPPIYSLSLWISFYFLIFSEIVFTVGLIVTEKIAERESSVFLRTGLYSAFALYLCLTFIVGLIFSVVLVLAIRWLLAIEILLTAIFFIVIILLIIAGKLSAKNDAQTMQGVRSLDSILARIENISATDIGKEYEKQMTSIYEALRYSDYSYSQTSNLDSSLYEEVLLLEQAVNEDAGKDAILSVISKINVLIEQRSVAVRFEKQGRI